MPSFARADALSGADDSGSGYGRKRFSHAREGKSSRPPFRSIVSDINKEIKNHAISYITVVMATVLVIISTCFFSLFIAMIFFSSQN